MTVRTSFLSPRRWLVPATLLGALALSPTLGCGGRQNPDAPQQSQQGSPLFSSRAAMIAAADRAAWTAVDAFVGAQIRLVQGNDDAALKLLLTPAVRWDDPTLSMARSVAVYRLRSTALDFDTLVAAWLGTEGLTAAHPFETWVRHELAHFVLVRQQLRENRGAPANGVPFGQSESWRVYGPVDVDIAVSPDRLGPAEGVASLADLPYNVGQTRYLSLPNVSRIHTAAVASGTSYAEAFVTVETPGEFLLVTVASHYYSVWINGVRVELSGPDQATDATQRARRIALDAGVHRVIVKQNATQSEGLSFRLVPLTGTIGAFSAHAGPATAGAPRIVDTASAAPARWLTRIGTDALDWLIAAEIAEISGDESIADGLLGDGFPAGDALAQFTRFRMTGLLRSLAPSLRDSLEFQELRDIDAAWFPMAGVSREIAAAQQRVGQLPEARATLGPVARASDAAPQTRLQYGQLLLASSMLPLAEQQLVSLVKDHPRWCAAISALASSQIQRGRFLQEADLGVGWETCPDVRRHVVAEVWQQRGDTDRAQDYYERVLARSPHRYDDWRAYLALPRIKGDPALLASSLARADQYGFDRSESARMRASLVAAADDVPGAMAILAQSVQRDASSFLTRLPLDFLGNKQFLHELRVDGEAAIAAYRADPNAVSGEIVYVLDYGRWHFAENGGGVALVHQIFELNSRDAIESMGEIDVPSGAALLSIRVIKPDGRSLIPDPIAGKTSISFPKLEVGDMVELEWARPIVPLAHDGEWYATGSFYFASTTGPMARSEMIVEYPTVWGENAVFDALRLDAASIETTKVGGLTRRGYLMVNQPEVRMEPSASDPDEFIAMASFSAFSSPTKQAAYFAARILPALVSSQAIDKRAARLTSDSSEPDAQIRALFRYVNDEIEQTSGFFSVDAQRTEAMEQGDRMALLYSLLRAAGYAPEVVFILPFDAPDVVRTPEQLGDWSSVALRVEAGGHVYWLDPSEDFAPFGALPSYAQGRPGFVVVGQTVGARYETPPLDDALGQKRMELHIALAADGSARIDSREIFTVEGGADMRRYLDYTPNPRDVERIYEQRESREYGGAQLQSLSFAAAADPDAPLVVSAVLDVPQMATTRGTSLSVDRGFALPLAAAMAADRVERTLPLLFDQEMRHSMRIELVAPDGYTIERAPAPVVLTWGTMRYEREVTVAASKKSVTWTRRMTIPRQRISPAAYPEFAAFMRQVMESERIRIDLSR